MNAKTKPAQSHKVRAAALIAAIVMSTSLFSAVVSLADQPMPTIVVAQADAPVQR
jgi:hypothetical protein